MIELLLFKVNKNEHIILKLCILDDIFFNKEFIYKFKSNKILQLLIK